jgi:hypothetical protein
MAEERITSDTQSAPELTDSPWFWATIFSSMAVAGAIAIAPKYNVRQRQIEIRQTARQRSVEYANRVAKADGDTQQARLTGPAEDYDQYVSQNSLLVEIAPIIGLLGTVFIVSLVRLCWVQAKSENAPVIDRKRGIVMLLAFIFYGRMLYSVWSTYGVVDSVEMIFLLAMIASILLALGLSAVWRTKRTA